MKVAATGHLIDAGILSQALDDITAAGGEYHVVTCDIGRARDEESHVVIDITIGEGKASERLLTNLLGLGFHSPEKDDVTLAPVKRAGVAPEHFYSTTNLPTRIRHGGRWMDVRKQRMDAVIVVDGGGKATCVKVRELERGQKVVVGHLGVQARPAAKERTASDFTFMSSDISSERRVEAQAKLLAELWLETKARGERVVIVSGPVVVHAGQAQSFVRLIEDGLVDAVLAGNALAVHDVEAAILGTSLGVSQETGEPVVHGHMNHMRAINLVRQYGGLAGAVKAGALNSGIMHALVKNKVPFSLAGSIRDDGPLPDTEMDLIAAQNRYTKLLQGAGLVIVLGSMLHGIGVGNMIPASVTFVCVDINPAVASKLCDRGSSHTVPIVTDVGLFISILARRLHRSVSRKKPVSRTKPGGRG